MTPPHPTADDQGPCRAGDTVRLAHPGDTQEAFDARGTVLEDSDPRTRHTRVAWHATPFSSQWHKNSELKRTSPGQVPAILAAVARSEQAARSPERRTP